MQRALFSSWYEFFPRSEGAHLDENGTWVSGTFDTAQGRLEAAAAMGFDVVYLPPIHPIGTSFRKGKNNTLQAGPGDPGSPWAIGNEAGGHDAIHPDLGDFDAFDRFVARAEELGLEIALDLALNASPDHPWVKEHPEWFSHRADGSIAYAENPPKKYQDIYNFNFDDDRDGIRAAWLEVVRLWISHGVRIFRVDNPHTKPVEFWAWLFAEVRKTDPDVLFLAEAFTKPAMMHALGKVGFHQGYTYFTWRNEKWELEEYLTELTTETDAFFRPNFFVNTPDILPSFLQWGGKTAFTIRAVLASTLSPTWGVYAGFELFENEVLARGREEYLNSEKFEYRPRDWAAADESGENLNLLLGRLNQIRREHPALQQLRDLTFHHAPHSSVIVYSKRSGDDVGDHGLQPGPDRHRGVGDRARHGGARDGTGRDLPGAGRDHRPVVALGAAGVRPAHLRRPRPRPHRGAAGRLPVPSAGHALMDPELTEQLLRHLTAARWFAGKGRRAEIGSLTALPWLTEVSQWPAVRVEIVRVDYPPAEDPEPDADDTPWPYELYQLLVAYHHAPVPGLQHAEIGRRTIEDLGPVIAYDAAQDPEACALLWRLLLAGGHARGREAEVSFQRTDVTGLDPDVTPVPFTGQQSNTSVMFGDVAMIKFFRRIELGTNLDIEVHDALARTGVTDVARLYGWIRGQWVQDGVPVEADLAMAVQKLAAAEDGWVSRWTR